MEYQQLLTAGPGQTDHIILPDGRVLLLVGENFNDELCIYELQRGLFSKVFPMG